MHTVYDANDSDDREEAREDLLPFLTLPLNASEPLIKADTEFGFNASFSFPAPLLELLSSPLGLFTEPSTTAPKKRSNPDPNPHLFSRTKKVKLCHRHVRSSFLLFNADTLPRRSATYPPSRTPAWYSTPIARETSPSSLCPGESIWVGGGEAWAGQDAINELYHKFTELCLASTDPLAKDKRSVESLLAEHFFVSASEPGALPEDELKRPHVLRTRSMSAPAALEFVVSDDGMAELPETSGQPPTGLPLAGEAAALKAQLLSVLRMRMMENGLGIARPGEAALKLRKWVAWNGQLFRLCTF